MRYPNAFRGVRNFYLAELLGLISKAILILLLILLEINSALSKHVFVAGLGAAAMLLGAAVLVLIAVGVFQAAKDEPLFQKARPAAIAAPVLAFLTLTVRETGAVRDILSIARDAASLWCVLCILKGILSLARQLKKPEMVERGKALYTVILLAGAAGLLLDIVLAAIPENTAAGSVVSMILTLLYTSLAVGESLLLYFYLRQTVRMLGNTKQK